MSAKYSWVNFTGVDLAPQTNGFVDIRLHLIASTNCIIIYSVGYQTLPGNVTLEIDDINLGLMVSTVSASTERSSLKDIEALGKAI